MAACLQPLVRGSVHLSVVMTWTAALQRLRTSKTVFVLIKPVMHGFQDLRMLK